jgi:hypothetical protein
LNFRERLSYALSFKDREFAAQSHGVQFVDELGCNDNASVEALYVLLQFPVSPDPTNILNVAPNGPIYLCDSNDMYRTCSQQDEFIQGEWENG